MAGHVIKKLNMYETFKLGGTVIVDTHAAVGTTLYYYCTVAAALTIPDLYPYLTEYKMHQPRTVSSVSSPTE